MTPRTDVVVRGARRKVTVTAVIDTGFDGDICLPTKVATELGLELIGAASVELADGSQHKELVFRGSAVFLGKRRRVEILLTESEEALLGTGLLAGCRMSVDFDTGKVRLARKPPVDRRKQT